jgi:hypothetical protein
MKSLISFALTLGMAATATGCIIESSNNNPPPPPPPPGTGTISASWDLQDWDDAKKQPVSAGCPAGADTAILYSLAAGDTNAAHATKDLFDCARTSDVSAGLNPGSYTNWIEITDHSGATLYAQSGSVTTTVTAGASTPASFQFQVNRGYIAGSWSLIHSNGSPANCTNLSGVEFVDTDASNPNNFITDQFKCTDGQGTTYPLPLTTYNTSVEALATQNGKEIQAGQAALVQGVKVQFGNDLENIGSVVITLDPGF